jgi:hypothetical protein
VEFEELMRSEVVARDSEMVFENLSSRKGQQCVSGRGRIRICRWSHRLVALAHRAASRLASPILPALFQFSKDRVGFLRLSIGGVLLFSGIPGRIPMVDFEIVE